ncbi:site-specific integrase [Streptomyces sp. NPDC018352]|uniref:site-specific integrase n=1 Tax=Streptomyces sp. NPDC018352 TaxID=3157194 RepID=UPI00340FF05B
MGRKSPHPEKFRKDAVALYRAVADPIGLITELVGDVEKQLGTETIRAVVTAVAGGRAKSRRPAKALAMRPAVLTDGRSPAPRAIGDLLIELRKAGASAVAAPVCVECGKKPRIFQRQGPDWYCSVCGQETAECTACGNVRRVGFRDCKGLPRCKMCPDTDDRDPATVVHELITVIAPGADRDVIAEALRRTAPQRPTYRQRLVWALEENPRLLTGEGHLAPHRAILRFIDLPHEAGVAGVVRPACPPLPSGGPHRQAAGWAAGLPQLHRQVPHRRMRTLRSPARAGHPRRRGMAAVSELPGHRPCERRGLHRLRQTPTSTEPHLQRPSLPQLLPPAHPGLLDLRSHRTRHPLPPDRSAPLRRLRQTPSSLHRLREARGIHSGTAEAPICGPCTAPDAELWRPCPTCGEAERLRSSGPCPRCTLKQRLHELLANGSGSIHPKLQAFHDALASTERAATGLRWLSGGIVSTVLPDLGSGRRPLTHEALDELPEGKVVEHIRSVLVASGALPKRDEQMVRLERHVKDLVTSHATDEGRKIAHRYATWHLLRRLRRRSRGNETTYYQLQVARQHLRAGVYVLDWLEGRNLPLATCRQADLERWMTSDDASLRQEAGHFVRWALSQKIARDLTFPAERWNGPSQPMDDEARWATARRLLHDDTLKPEDRLVGLLLLLYAQWPAAISRLTVDHIEEMDGAVRIRLGAMPVELPAPVAELALQQVEVAAAMPSLAARTRPGSSPEASLAARSVPGPWANDSANSASGSRRPARPRCSSSPPSCPPRSSPAPSASTSPSPSNGREPPPETGRLTQPRSAAGPRQPDPCIDVRPR